MRTAAVLIALMLLVAVKPHALAAPIEIKKHTDLRFGRYATSLTQGGTVTVHANTGQKTLTGAVTDLGGRTERGQFIIAGDRNAAFSIRLPRQITIMSGKVSMTVNAFTSSPSGSGVLDPNGRGTLFVGATLNLSAKQEGGFYIGKFAVTVEYQ